MSFDSLSKQYNKVYIQNNQLQQLPTSNQADYRTKLKDLPL